MTIFSESSSKYREASPIKKYLETILLLKNLPISYVPVLLFFLKHMSQNCADSRVIYVNVAMKNKIAKDLKLSIANVNYILSDLVKSQILLETDVDTYTANPELFGKEKLDNMKNFGLEIFINDMGEITISSAK